MTRVQVPSRGLALASALICIATLGCAQPLPDRPGLGDSTEAGNEGVGEADSDSTGEDDPTGPDLPPPDLPSEPPSCAIAQLDAIAPAWVIEPESPDASVEPVNGLAASDDRVFVGLSREDGTSQAIEARDLDGALVWRTELAESPSAIAWDGTHLYFGDAPTRRMDADGQVDPDWHAGLEFGAPRRTWVDGSDVVRTGWVEEPDPEEGIGSGWTWIEGTSKAGGWSFWAELPLGQWVSAMTPWTGGGYLLAVKPNSLGLRLTGIEGAPYATALSGLSGQPHAVALHAGADSVLVGGYSREGVSPNERYSAWTRVVAPDGATVHAHELDPCLGASTWMHALERVDERLIALVGVDDGTELGAPLLLELDADGAVLDVRALSELPAGSRVHRLAVSATAVFVAGLADESFVARIE